MAAKVHAFPIAERRRRELERQALVKSWSSLWSDKTLDILDAYHAGMAIGHRVVHCIRQDRDASRWLLSELVDAPICSERQYRIRDGVLDALVDAVATGP